MPRNAGQDKPQLLIVSQTYVPDPAAVGQTIHGASAEMVRRGWRVIVYTSARGYEDPDARYPKRETRDGVEIRRLPFSSFGKASIPIRLLGGMIFIAQVMLRTLFIRRPDAALVSTSPPMAMIAGVWLRALRGVHCLFWAMDINPDQMVAVGKITQTSLPARVFNMLDRAILKRAKAVVALDRFMAETLERKTPVGERMHIMPPWPLGDQLEPVDHGDNPFRQEHGLQDKFVVMYSGNISPVHPVDTLFQGVAQLEDPGRLQLVFIGNAAGRKHVEHLAEQHGVDCVLTLPYQPLDRLKFSLSAADVHLVSMGDAMVGIVHPCKVYGAMAVARPVLLLGPAQCHISEILDAHECGWQVRHGDTAAAAQTLGTMLQATEAELAEMGRRARQAADGELSCETLTRRFCDLLERLPDRQ